MTATKTAVYWYRKFYITTDFRDDGALRATIKELCEELGVAPPKVEFAEMLQDRPNLNGRYYPQTKTIVIYRAHLRGVHTTLMHELGHHLQHLHDFRSYKRSWPIPLTEDEKVEAREISRKRLGREPYRTEYKEPFADYFSLNWINLIQRISNTVTA